MPNTWDDAIDDNDDLQRKTKKEIIHPSGNNEIDYFNSGKQAALYIIESCHLKKDDNILEYGCGDGRILRHLDGHYSVSGVDIVKDFVLESHKYNLTTFHLDDVCDVKYDKVYSFTVFIHLNKENSLKALQYIYDHLKEGGKAYLQILVYGLDHDANEFFQLNFWKKETLEKMVKSVGFKVENIEIMNGDIHNEKWADNHNKFCIFQK